jgi:hypothetical protein
LYYISKFEYMLYLWKSRNLCSKKASLRCILVWFSNPPRNVVQVRRQTARWAAPGCNPAVIRLIVYRSFFWCYVSAEFIAEKLFSTCWLCATAEPALNAARLEAPMRLNSPLSIYLSSNIDSQPSKDITSHDIEASKTTLVQHAKETKS